jgi:hypothetical protein
LSELYVQSSKDLRLKITISGTLDENFATLDDIFNDATMAVAHKPFLQYASVIMPASSDIEVDSMLDEIPIDAEETNGLYDLSTIKASLQPKWASQTTISASFTGMSGSVST